MKEQGKHNRILTVLFAAAVFIAVCVSAVSFVFAKYTSTVSDKANVYVRLVLDDNCDVSEIENGGKYYTSVLPVKGESMPSLKKEEVQLEGGGTEIITLLPKRSNYSFSGYYSVKYPDGTEKSKIDEAKKFYDNDGTAIKGKLWDAGTNRLYAFWEKGVFKITFDVNDNRDPDDAAGITGINPEYVVYGSPILYADETVTEVCDPAGAEWECHIFEGWWTDNGSVTDGSIDNDGYGTCVIDKNGHIQAGVTGFTDESGNWVPEEDCTFFARWTEYRKITFDNEKAGGTYYDADGTESGSRSYYVKINDSDTALYIDEELTNKAVNVPYVMGRENTYKIWYTEEYESSPFTGERIFDDGGLIAEVDGFTDSSGRWIIHSDITVYSIWYTIMYRKYDNALPIGYCEIDSLQSTGNQAIATGIEAKPSIGIEISFNAKTDILLV